MRARLKLGYLVAFIGGLLVSQATAQISGDIQVQVSDPSAAAVPGATVRIKSPATAATRKMATDLSGTARFSQLAVGEWAVGIEAEGFAPQAFTALVHSGAVTSLPVRLAIQGQQQEIVVRESGSLVNTVNAQFEHATGSRDITVLPITLRGPLTLAGNGPGVIPVSSRNSFLGIGSFNANGGRGRANNITLDNATASDVTVTGAAGIETVPLDAIGEVNFITGNFNAEYGRNASSQAQVLTKSGTNAIHGSLFEFFRNDKLNSRDWFDRTGRPSVLRDNTWGAAIGGPIRRDRIFWHGAYQQQKTRGQGGTAIARVPTTAQMTAATDPTAKALLSQLQVPSSPSGTVASTSPLAVDFISFSGRVDANLTQNDFFYARYGIADVSGKSPGLTFISSNLPTNGASAVNRPMNATLSETHVFSPATVNQFLASFGRATPVFATLADFGGPEVVFADGTSNFGISTGFPQGRVQNTFQYLDTLTHIRGRHQWKFGGEFNRIQANSFLDANVRGTLVFLALDDLLQGRSPFQYTQRFGTSVRGHRANNTFFFAQDDFRITRRLTLNLGMRLEVAGGVSEVNGILSKLNLDRHDVMGAAGAGPLGTIEIGGAYSKTNWNWAPRVGFAWNPGGGKTTLRAGYGIAYDFLYLGPMANGRFLPPFMYNFTLPQTGFTGSNTLANLLGGTSDFQRTGVATIGTFGSTIRNFGNMGPIDQALKNPQVQQWSLTLESEVLAGWSVRAAYVGAKANFLQRTRPINTMAPGLFTPPQTLEEEAARRASGEFTRLNAGLAGAPTGQSNRIDPRFNSVGLIESSANSNYHSAQFFVSRRYRGYAFTAAYTISKSIDDVSDALAVLATDMPAQQNPFNNRDNRGVSQFDVPQRLVITHRFEPAFTARISNRFGRALAHGWSFAGIFQAQSGFPQNLISGARAGLAEPLLLGGAGALRPDLSGPLQIQFDANGLAASPNKVTGSGLTQPLVGHFGTLGRNVIRLNPLLQADWTVAKRFAISERVRTEIQAQAFNVFNNTTFKGAGNSIAAPATFGYYQDTDTDPRSFTLVLRLIW